MRRLLAWTSWIGILLTGVILVVYAPNSWVCRKADGGTQALYNPKTAAILVVYGNGEYAEVWNNSTDPQPAHTYSFVKLPDTLRHVMYSPDGKTLLTEASNGMFDSTAKLWDAQSGTLLHTLSEDVVTSAVYSPDGKTVLTWGLDGTAKLWDAEAGTFLRTWSGLDAQVQNAVYSFDGETVLTWSNGAIRLWDVQSGTPLYTASDYGTNVFMAMLPPNGTSALILTNTEGFRVLMLWEVQTGVELYDFGNIPGANCVAYSPDGGTVLAGDIYGTSNLWDARSGTLLHTLSAPNNPNPVNSFAYSNYYNPVISVAYSPDGKTVFTGNYQGTANLWDARSGMLLHTLPFQLGGVVSATYSPDSKTILTGSGYDVARLWDAETGAFLRPLCPLALEPFGSVIGFALCGVCLIGGLRMIKRKVA